jgi:hypothetical protein
MTYVLSRAAIVVLAWGMTCGLIMRIWPAADPMTFAIAGISWVCAGAAYFAYLRKLRRAVEDDHRNRRYGIRRGAI